MMGGEHIPLVFSRHTKSHYFWQEKAPQNCLVSTQYYTARQGHFAQIYSLFWILLFVSAVTMTNETIHHYIWVNSLMLWAFLPVPIIHLSSSSLLCILVHIFGADWNASARVKCVYNYMFATEWSTSYVVPRIFYRTIHTLPIEKKVHLVFSLDHVDLHLLLH